MSAPPPHTLLIQNFQTTRHFHSNLLRRALGVCCCGGGGGGGRRQRCKFEHFWRLKVLLQELSVQTAREAQPQIHILWWWWCGGGGGRGGGRGGSRGSRVRSGRAGDEALHHQTRFEVGLIAQVKRFDGRRQHMPWRSAQHQRSAQWQQRTGAVPVRRKRTVGVRRQLPSIIKTGACESILASHKHTAPLHSLFSPLKVKTDVPVL